MASSSSWRTVRINCFQAVYPWKFALTCELLMSIINEKLPTNSNDKQTNSSVWTLLLFLTRVNYVCKCKCEQLPGCYVRRYRLNSFWNLGRISRLMFTLFVFHSLFSVDGILFCNCNEVVVWCVWINLPCRGLLLTSLAFSISRLENLIRSRFDWAKFFNQFEIILIFSLGNSICRIKHPWSAGQIS